MIRYFSNKTAAAAYVADQLLYLRPNSVSTMTITVEPSEVCCVRIVTGASSDDTEPQTVKSSSPPQLVT